MISALDPAKHATFDKEERLATCGTTTVSAGSMSE